MPSQSLHRASMHNLRRLKGIIWNYKRILGILGILGAVISFIASTIGILVFLTGIQSCPDVWKKLWYDSAKKADPSATFYAVKLLLPARMSGAEIFVDGQPATVTDQASTVITVQVEEKTTGHRFTAKKGEAVCTQPPQLIRENNVIIHPCQ